MSRRRAIGLLVLFLGACVGCGYHLARRGTEIPANVRTLAIPVFENRSYEPGVEDLVTDALIQEFHRHRWVRIVSSSEADAILTGVVRDFTTTPIAFSTKDYAAEYRAQARCSIWVKGRDGHVLWSDENISVDEDYQANTDIFLSEGNKRRAIQLLAADLAEEVHDRIFNGF